MQLVSQIIKFMAHLIAYPGEADLKESADGKQGCAAAYPVSLGLIRTLSRL